MKFTDIEPILHYVTTIIINLHFALSVIGKDFPVTIKSFYFSDDHFSFNFLMIF